MAAAHLDAKISRQIAPVTDDIFGCHRFVVNRTFGGLNGYVGGISEIITSLLHHRVIMTSLLRHRVIMTSLLRHRVIITSVLRHRVIITSLGYYDFIITSLCESSTSNLL